MTTLMSVKDLDMKKRSLLSAVVDYSLPPTFLLVGLLATYLLLEHEVPAWTVSTIVVAPLIVIAALLERARPERLEYRPLDLPLLHETAHFVLNWNTGYLLALGACSLLGAWLLKMGWQPLWPGHWHPVAQVALASVLAEGVAYWQHRLVHRVPWLWRFHALHHHGERLNLLRAGRFHFVDIGTAAFLVFLPAVLLGAPEGILAWTAMLGGVQGILEHANMRMRTPRWLDWIICTPAVHRYHHSRAIEESDANFGTMVMIFDIVFGTFQPPRRLDGPEAVGIEDDPMPTGFWAQIWAPFRGA